jgi:hypothetical protein
MVYPFPTSDDFTDYWLLKEHPSSWAGLMINAPIGLEIQEIKRLIWRVCFEDLIPPVIGTNKYISLKEFSFLYELYKNDNLKSGIINPPQKVIKSVPITIFYWDGSEDINMFDIHLVEYTRWIAEQEVLR